MKISRLLSSTVALTGLAALSISTAFAQSVTPVFISPTGGAAGNVTFTYQLFATADTKVSPGDVFTIYDFNGLRTDAGNAPAFTPGGAGVSYAVSTQLLGINPPFTAQLAGDNPSLLNVSLTYNGTAFVNSGSSSQFLGTLVLHSTNALTVGSFTPFAVNSTKNSDGTPAGNQGFIQGPNVAVPGTPEPGTWAMLVGMGISGAAFARRRNRRK